MSDRRPTVALVSDAIFPYHRGGKETRYHEVARRLTRHADVHVYTMNWWDGEPVRRENGVELRAISPHLPLYAGERRSIKQAVVFALACLKLLGRRYDVIWADHMPYFQLFTLRLVAALRRKRLFATWHEYWGPDYWRRYLGAAGRIGWWIERASMRLPHGIIAASDETAERLRDWVGESVPVMVAPHGVDLESMTAVACSDDVPTDLVVVGRLIDHKRIDLLLDTVALLRARGRPVTARIIGDGPERDALHERAERLGITDLVDFRHDVAELTDVYGLLKAGRLFVFPSEREGFGAAVLEALACGLPVIATAAPDNLARHLIEGSSRGVVTNPTPDALADAVERGLDDPDRNGTGERRHDAWLRQFDWNSLTDRVAETVL